MGCCSSKKLSDGTYEPSSFAKMVAVPQKTNFQAQDFSTKHTGEAKVLVVCTDDGRFKTANGKIFSSGNHPVEVFLPLMHFKSAGFNIEFATVSGKPVVLEVWALPKKDEAVMAFYEEMKPLLASPTKLEAIDLELNGFAGIYLPGGHGCMINLPESVSLGKLLITAHAANIPTIALCHGPAALLAASKVPENADFPYKGYKCVTFSDKTDKQSPSIGYLPGQLEWHQQEALKAQGMQILNTSEKGATHVDRELVTGDGPAAANEIGKIASPMLVSSWTQRHT